MPQKQPHTRSRTCPGVSVIVPGYPPLVLAYALVELGSQEAVDVFLRREAAFAAPSMTVSGRARLGSGPLYVAPIVLDERSMSAN